MPTVLPSGEKAAFISIVKTQNPYEAALLPPILNNYEDIAPIGIGRQFGIFASNPAYLKEAIGVFTDTQLINVGIFNAKSSSSPLVNPVLLINSIYTGGITISSNQMALGLIGASSINTITINAGINLTNLVIGPGSTVDLLDITATGAYVNNITIMFGNSTPAFLNAIKSGSKFGNVDVEDGSFYGGILNIDPEATCAAGPVTGLMAEEITHDSIVLMWAPPASGYLFINVFYKKTESQIWIPVTPDDGDYIQSAGFVFRSLKSDTYYDFRVQVICNNGGVANATISAQTVCCGSTQTIVPATNCLINVYIKATPDLSKMITLCNGVQIQQEYPEGATLTIPYLANKNITADLVISNVIYQAMPYNKATGTWDASTTPVLLFQEPNIVSIQAQLPI